CATARLNALRASGRLMVMTRVRPWRSVRTSSATLPHSLVRIPVRGETYYRSFGTRRPAWRPSGVRHRAERFDARLLNVIGLPLSIFRLADRVTVGGPASAAAAHRGWQN